MVQRSTVKIWLLSVGDLDRYTEEWERERDGDLDADADGDSNEDEEKDELDEEPRRENSTLELSIHQTMTRKTTCPGNEACWDRLRATARTPPKSTPHSTPLPFNCVKERKSKSGHLHSNPVNVTSIKPRASDDESLTEAEFEEEGLAAGWFEYDESTPDAWFGFGHTFVVVTGGVGAATTTVYYRLPYVLVSTGCGMRCPRFFDLLFIAYIGVVPLQHGTRNERLYISPTLQGTQVQRTPVINISFTRTAIMLRAQFRSLFGSR
ncbi:hypothetical protein AAF712_011287 [Marasmius tenuissimus]|uniref:Uncharacterized protein n=1 Tax=Marasmius tenuissimus TaxID=585030 RepID=A0ABR2ZJL8_9AGAR